jgi:hypothetical protein
MQAFDTIVIVITLSHQPEAREAVVRFAADNFETLMKTFPGFARPQVIHLFDGFCTPQHIEKVEAYVRPKLAALGGGELELAQSKERIGLCVALKNAKAAEIATTLAR